jgi:hypothetical protein
MTWNYRVRKTKHKNGEISFEIVECYYGKNRKDIVAESVDAMAPHGETITALENDLQYMLAALKKPVLKSKGKGE